MRRLYSDAGRSLPEIPWARYPRPQMWRDDWLCLNGEWELRINQGYRASRDCKIRVPFCPESLLSGVEQPPKIGDQLVYRRAFTIPETWRGRRVLLHFGAVMRSCRVCVNGKELCRHENGYLPFTVDITDALREGNNELAVFCENDLDHTYPWGKQSVRRGGMWYTPCSGIWQTVWLEPAPETYIRALQIETGADYAVITAEGVIDGEVLVNGERYPLKNGSVRVPVKSPRFWSPEDPFLYDFTLLSGEDRVEAYFALRTLSVENVKGIPRLCLNGKPYFFNGLLDQGYWSDGLYTPAAPEGFEQDIRAMKSLGFNTLRKHIKIEPEQFYYDCDRLGMIVFQDMVNNGDYAYIRDTVLPTLHFQKRRDKRLHRDPESRRVFLQSMEETVQLLRSHPCVCLWTIFNEGWGQFEADKAYERLKALDASRFIDATSGWFHQKQSDVDSLHIYFDTLHLGKKPLPQFLSEFGGYVWKIPEHSFNTDKTYGYRKYETREAFVAALRETYGEVLPKLVRGGLCAAIYTQVSDVEDETNGFLTFDRAVCKAKSEELSALMAALQEAVG